MALKQSRKSPVVQPAVSQSQTPAGVVPLLTPEQIATMLGISRLAVIRKAAQGTIPAIHIGKAWRFRPSTIDSWLQSQEQGGAA